MVSQKCIGEIIPSLVDAHNDAWCMSLEAFALHFGTNVQGSSLLSRFILVQLMFNKV